MDQNAGQDTLESARPSLNPMRLAIGDAARALQAAGGRSVTVESLRADIDAGAPTNADGTINLIHYAAWLVKQSVVRSPEAAGAITAHSRGGEGYGPQTPDSGLQTPDSGLQTPNYGLNDGN